MFPSPGRRPDRLGIITVSPDVSLQLAGIPDMIRQNYLGSLEMERENGSDRVCGEYLSRLLPGRIARKLAMSLRPPAMMVEKLHKASHVKAKDSPDSRFYALYEKLDRRDILEWACAPCRANNRALGSFEDIEACRRKSLPADIFAR
jgi:hypothetical protein